MSLPTPAVMNRALSARAPAENIEQATLRLRQLGFELSINRKLAFQIDRETGETKGWRNELDTLSFSAKPNADHNQAGRIVAALLAPAKDEEIHVWLADLSAVTARRSEGEAEGMLTLAAYTERLLNYPADIVRFVLHDWRGKWFPTWGELCDELEAMTKERIAMRDRLLEMLNGSQRKQIAHDPVAEHLAKLRDELAAAERVASRYPELADSSARKRQAIADEIAKLEGRAATPSSP